MELNLKDKKILYELEVDSSRSISDIAKKVRLSREVTTYRIKRLEKERLK